MYRLLIILFPLMVHAEDVKEQKIADISVEDLTNIVRMVVQKPCLTAWLQEKWLVEHVLI